MSFACFAARAQNPGAGNPGNPVLPGGVSPAPGQPLANVQTEHNSSVSWNFSGGYSGYIVTDALRGMAVYHGTIAHGCRELADARYRRAQAEGQLELANRYNVTNAILSDELFTLQKMERQADFQFRKENAMVQQVNKLKLGQIGPKQFHALGYFFAHTLSPHKLRALLSQRVVPLAAADNFDSLNPKVAPVDFPGGNLGEFLLFLKTHNLKAKEAGTASQAFDLLSKVMTQIEESVQQEFQRRQAQQNTVRQSILSVFQPK